ncbi:acetyl/propionyl-CoA carboxylase subunit alpha [Mycolicibacterium duvalii]|uniref:biotin carboxylase n=1 Tax=Mycolicibacterium duvalii TaxID=39688 RepID=A0A7I7KAB9_9MYCO|nr:biotin carboxylase N-terminal domain-containing protein [Mycolicibacterium duvalii]MCV7368338.1 acetyl/propionyl-CoA carboxylase subunit alpha [Mycolicibacterium duvalii]PEG35685.1 acetyl/propionyl-CoA carboxylase subunit alpha [Mycolicibacterium duvalii]BBX20438.1 acetyl/propionyl-CoA carboxylase subuit alpha [Mycolicibacterium duvalii]
MIAKVLVANRGEIARRVFATCRRLGIGTVAVYTDPDADSPHVAEADARVRLDGTRGYLDMGQLIAAAHAAGADAVHPGYGFLSENPDFAAAVQEAGLTWVGPPVAAVAAMGSKIEAKKLMAGAGVPVLEQLDPDTVTPDMLPVLVKASAGGGGRGMRVVRDLADLPAQVAAASREAQAAFGDPTVFCERYLETGHHVEVQILADRHGTVWAVGERECSIQRRHQKIIEEAPSPLVQRHPGMRDRLFDAARLAATAIDYTGAGTVEFMAAEDGSFYFLEMNTRLQVEHPVTELTTGLDLVELQFAVADGARLEAAPPPMRGHSIEARLYAEDPARDWQPQPGPVHRLTVPHVVSEFGPVDRLGVRLDSGVSDGSQISVFYDPMIAKVISVAPTRAQASMVLADALIRARVHGVRTNRDLLVNVLRHSAFTEGATDTAFLDRHGLAELAAPAADADTVALSVIAAALADAAYNRSTATVLAALPSGWRNLPSGHQVKRYRDADDVVHEVQYRHTRDGVQITGRDDIVAAAATPQRVVLTVGGVDRPFDVARYGADVFVDSPGGAVALSALPRYGDPADALAHGSLLAPMPGSVLRVGAGVGDRVSTGQPLVWLEAMKMEHTISAPADGVLAEINVEPGQQVELGAVLARVESP